MLVQILVWTLKDFAYFIAIKNILGIPLSFGTNIILASSVHHFESLANGSGEYGIIKGSWK